MNINWCGADGQITQEPLAEVASDRLGAKRVALDFDGLLTSPHTLKAAELRRRGVPATLETTSRAHFMDAGWPMEAYEAATDFVNVQCLDDVPPEKGAQQGLTAFREAGLKIYVASARYDEEVATACRYIARHRLAVDGMIGSGRKSKAEILRRLKPQLFVEDSPNRFRELLGDVDCQLVLYEHVANRNFRTDDLPVVRISGGWSELTTYVLNHFRGADRE